MVPIKKVAPLSSVTGVSVGDKVTLLGNDAMGDRRVFKVENIERVTEGIR